MSKSLFGRLLPVLALGVIVASIPAHAGTISLAWDSLDHPDLVGYRIYYGTSPTQLGQTASVGTTPEATLTGLASCTTYYIAVKGVAGDGSESAALSNIVSGWARPELVALAPQTIERGASGAFVLTGDNFQPGATVLVSDPSVTVAGVTVSGCSQIMIDLEADSAAPLGSLDVTVVNPDQVYGSAAGLLEVVEDQTAPAITSLHVTDVGSTTASVAWDTDEPANGQAFFRELGESAWQSTAVVSALTTTHSIALTGLVPETEYEFSARSVDQAGNAASADGPATFTTSANGFAYMRIEAEGAGVTSPIESVDDTAAFAGAFIRVQAGTPNGSASDPAGLQSYGFNVPAAGTWQVWLRMYAPTGSADAWFEGMDGGGLSAVQAAGQGTWEWVAARSYTLGAGLHTFELGGYEANVRVDRILITDDPAFAPSEQPGADVDPPASVSGLSAVPGDGVVTLNWTNPTDSDLERVVVRYATGGTAPANPYDGYPVADLPASPGAGAATEHSGLVNGTTYSYAVFAVDATGNVSASATVQGTPEQPVDPPGTVQNLRRTDTLAP